jgi:hypothetical protein
MHDKCLLSSFCLKIVAKKVCKEAPVQYYIIQSFYLVFLSKVFIVQELSNGRGLVVWFSCLVLTFNLEAYEN